jgi:hypothetical protein
MTITGDATVQFEGTLAALTIPAPTYEAMVLRVRVGDEHSDRRLEAELNKLGAEGWYPSGSIGDDILILSRVKSIAGPATKVTVTWGQPQPIPKGP